MLRGFHEEEERKVNKPTLFLSDVSKSKIFRLITAPEYMPAEYLLCRMSLNKMIPYQQTHTHTFLVHHLYFRSAAFQKQFSSG